MADTDTMEIKLRKALEEVLPYTEAERLAEAAAVRLGQNRDPIHKAVLNAKRLLAILPESEIDKGAYSDAVDSGVMAGLNYPVQEGVGAMEAAVRAGIAHYVTVVKKKEIQ